MKNKKGLFVKENDYDALIAWLRSKNIRYTSMNGIFHFDLISLIIGVVIALAFGIVLF